MDSSWEYIPNVEAIQLREILDTGNVNSLTEIDHQGIRN